MIDAQEGAAHMTAKIIHKTYKFRIYPTKHQAETLDWTLDRCCELYNAGLQERRDAWRINRISVTFNQQSATLPEVKEVRPEYKQIHSDILIGVVRRVDRAFQGFFRRVRQGSKAGFPRFRPRARYNSFAYSHKLRAGYFIEGNHLRLTYIGSIKIKLHRLIEGEIKGCTIKREAGRWYACFVAECGAQPLPESQEQVGVDVGLTAFATLSDGTEVENPHYYREAQKALRIAQRKVSRRKKGSHRRRKAVQLLQRAHAHIRNQRSNFHHKISRWIVSQYGLIAVEDLNFKGLVRGMLSKSINDAGWSAFIDKIAYKAESAGRGFVKVDPRGTSQRCTCGAGVPKTLSQRWHECSNCGLSVSRDHASALEILRLAVSLQAPTSPVAECVA